MNAVQIFERLRSEYANARSYRDNAKFQSFASSQIFDSKTFSVQPDKVRREYTDFSGWFDKPFEDDPATGISVFWSDGLNCYRKRFCETEVAQEPSLSSALFSDSFVIKNVSLQPLLLLFPDIDGGHGCIQSFCDVRRRPDDFLGNDECYRISGSLHSIRDAELWIDTETFALRRIRQKVWFAFMHELDIADDLPDPDQLPVNVDCIFEIAKLNEPIDDSKFHFPG